MDQLQVIPEEVKEKLRQLLQARSEHAAALAAEQRAKKELDKIELEVFDLFSAEDENGEPNIKGTLKVPLGPPWGTQSFRTRETHFAQIVDDDAVAEHYEQRGMIDEVSAPKFVKKRLNEDVREAIDLGQPLPPGLSYYTNRGMTITQQK